MKFVLPFQTRRIKRRALRLQFTKRQQFVGITAVLTVGLLLTQLASLEWRYPMAALLSFCTFFLAAFGLREDLKGVEWMTLLTLPTLFTTAVSVFYFLLPARWLTRLPIAVLYGVGIYALLLTENIYNVAADRSIALLRAAHSVGFLLTIFTYFLLTSAILAVRLSPLINSVFIAVISFLLVFQSLWAVQLEEHVPTSVRKLSIVITLILSEFVWGFSFWPIKLTLIGLFLTTALYGMVSLGQQYLGDRLYKKSAAEFFGVVLSVFFLIICTAQWRGGM